MIYLLLKGGIGNQLLQFGAALRASNFNITQLRIIIDEKNPVRCKLNDIFTKKSLPEFMNIDEFISTIQNYETLYKINDVSSPILDTPILDNLPPDYNFLLDGYFQSSASAMAVRFHFLIPGNSCLTDINISPVASIHHRYGDYSRLDVQKELGLINLSYYDRCLNEGRLENYCFNFLSDSDYILKYSNNISRISKSIIGGNDIESFNILRCSEVIIIPNSTYSLMAAFLSVKLKLLIRPALWSRKWASDELTIKPPFETKYIFNSFVNIETP